MATLTLRNVPDHLVARLKERAAQHGRSLNSEIITFLERGLGTRPIDAEELIADLRAFRASLSMPETTAEEIQSAREFGRR